MPNRTYLMIPWLALAWIAGAHGDAFKCRMSDGKVVISATACEGGSKTLAVQAGESVTPEQRLQAEQQVERQRRFLTEQDAARAAEERREEKRAQEARQKLAEQEASQRVQCLQNAQQEPDPHTRADLIAACNGAAPQRPVVVQQPVLIPVTPPRRPNRPGIACLYGDCGAVQDKGAPKPSPSTPSVETKSNCQQVGKGVRCS